MSAFTSLIKGQIEKNNLNNILINSWEQGRCYHFFFSWNTSAGALFLIEITWEITSFCDVVIPIYFFRSVDFGVAKAEWFIFLPKQIYFLLSSFRHSGNCFFCNTGMGASASDPCIHLLFFRGACVHVCIIQRDWVAGLCLCGSNQWVAAHFWHRLNPSGQKVCHFAHVLVETFGDFPENMLLSDLEGKNHCIASLLWDLSLLSPLLCVDTVQTHACVFSKICWKDRSH